MVVAGKYDIIVENHEFKVVSKDKSDDRYIGISLEKFYHDPSLISIENVIKFIEIETAEFFGDEKVVCYPQDKMVANTIKNIVLANKLEFDPCDCE